jgi:exonuclease III
LIYSGHEEGALHTQGVGHLLSRQATSSMMEWTPVSLHIITAILYTQVMKTIIVHYYAPTNESDEQMKEDFYDELQSTLKQKKKGGILILMGDINAKIGNNNNGREQIICKEGLGGIMNENRELFWICVPSMVWQ